MAEQEHAFESQEPHYEQRMPGDRLSAQGSMLKAIVRTGQLITETCAIEHHDVIGGVPQGPGWSLTLGHQIATRRVTYKTLTKFTPGQVRMIIDRLHPGVNNDVGVSAIAHGVFHMGGENDIP